MPREIAHFLAIDHLLDSLPDLEALVKSQKRGLEALYLGSITPDSPYYFPLGASEEVAEFIHGRDGNDTFFILRKLIQSSHLHSIEKNELLYLFSIGVLSHIVLDAVVHPLVNSLSGDYYAKNPGERKQARTLHRRLETDLDFYLLTERKPKYESLLSLFFSIGRERKHLARFLNEGLREGGIVANYHLYWFSHAMLYSIFDSSIFAELKFLPSEINALCGRGRDMDELFSVRKKYPKIENLYFPYEGDEIDLLDSYSLAKEILSNQVKLFMEDPSKYLLLRGPSLCDGTVQL